MLTTWLKSDSLTVVNSARNLAAEMIACGMTILRIKVESILSNDNVPTLAKDGHYYEFHFKVSIENNSDWNSLADLC